MACWSIQDTLDLGCQVRKESAVRPWWDAEGEFALEFQNGDFGSESEAFRKGQGGRGSPGGRSASIFLKSWGPESMKLCSPRGGR